MVILLPYYVRRVQAVAGAAGAPVAIWHDMDGFFAAVVRGAGSITFDYGDGNTETGSLPKVFTHTYSGTGHKIIVTGDVEGITEFETPSVKVSAVDLRKLISLQELIIYNTYAAPNPFSDISKINMQSLVDADLRLNRIVDISPLANALNLEILALSGNVVMDDISPIVALPKLTNINLAQNRIVYPPEGLTWAQKTEGTYNFTYTGSGAGYAAVVRQVDWWLNDLADAGWDNSTGANSVDIRYTHPVTALSDAARDTLAGNGVTVQFDIKDFMIVNGDSNSIDVSTAHMWPYYMDNVTWNAGHYKNLAVAGKRSDTIDSEFNTQDAYYEAPTGQTGYYFILAGTNDLRYPTPWRSSEDIIATLASIYAKAKAVYGNVVALHILPMHFASDEMNAEREIRRLAINAYIDTDPNVDVVVPVPALLADPEDPTYYSDGIHLTQPVGVEILSAAVEVAMGW